jgi:5'-3' exonuclease
LTLPNAGAVHLVDASPYIFRAHHSLPSSIRAADGSPAAATYGFTSFLLKLIDDEAVSHLGVAFDRSLTTSFRNEIYPAYKAQREPPPPEVEAQLDACVEVAAALGAATFIDDRYEADDLIATLRERLRGGAQPVVVVTSDKDLAQLVDERTSLLDFAKGVRFTPAEVFEKFGVRPEQIVDFLALAGDVVDNIPGVRGIGAKGAAQLLGHFGSLADLYERLEELPRLPWRGAGALRAKLEAGREAAFLSRSLAEVHRQVPGVRAGLADLAFAGADRKRVDPLFDRLGFGRIRERIGRWR